MREIQLLIVEDDATSSLHLELLLTELKYSNVTIVESAEDALLKINLSKPDILLVDIALKGQMNGIQLAEHIQELNIPVIFTTGFGDDTVYSEAKKTAPFAYLTKPIGKIALESTVESAIRTMNSAYDEEEYQDTSTLGMEEEIFIKSANKLVKIRISEILAIEGEGNYCTFFTPEKKLVVKLSLNKLIERLDPNEFMRLHRNYIIQISKIDTVLLMSNEVKIGQFSFPIGRKFKKDFIAKLKKF